MSVNRDTEMHKEGTNAMSGVGKFKLTRCAAEEYGQTCRGRKCGVEPGRPKASARPSPEARRRPRARPGTHEQAAEQLREARESSQAKNAEASIRGHMVDIGRGNQQAGRQKAK